MNFRKNSAVDVSSVNELAVSELENKNTFWNKENAVYCLLAYNF